MPPCMIRSRRCTGAMCIIEKGDDEVGDEEIQQLINGEENDLAIS